MTLYKCRRPIDLWTQRPGQAIVRIVRRWRPGGKPRNVAVRDALGFTWIRPFRGMRKTSERE